VYGQTRRSAAYSAVSPAESAALTKVAAVLNDKQLRKQLGGDNMKNLDCTEIKDAARRIRLGKPAKALIPALLIASLLAVGCSSEKKPVSNETQPATNQATPNQSSVPAVTSSAVPETPASAPKKVAKKRPAIAKYSDPTYGVSFSYPRIYGLMSDSKIESSTAPMNFVQPGGVTPVSLEMPKGMFPDTDLSTAFFRVSVNKSMTEAECRQFVVPEASDKNPAQPSKLTLGGLELQQVEDIFGDEGEQGDTKYYHLFQNGACYEFALGLSTESSGDDDGIQPVNREKVFRRLETILASVKIQPANPAPQVAAAPVTAPSTQDAPQK
jgi:hypothetical protein